MPAPTNKRVAVPFLFRAADGLGPNGKLLARSYGATVEGVFTRAGTARYATDGGLGIAAHSQPRLGPVYGQHALTLAPAETNIVLYSEDFSNGAWTKSNVTANAATIGGVSMGLFSDVDGVSVTASAYQTVTFTGNGTKAVSVFVYAGTSPSASVQLFDSTAGAIRGTLDLAFTNGVPTATFDTGGGATGTAFPVESYGNGLYRVGFTATGVVAANSNGVYLYGTDNNTGSATGTVYMGGVQARDAGAPGCYVKTTSASAANAADVLYFPYTLVPQAVTVYVRFVESGMASGGGSQGVCSLGSGTNPSLLLLTGGAGGYYAVHRQGSDVFSVAPSGTAVFGDAVELRLTITSGGVVNVGQSINGGTETVGTPSSALALPSAWNATRLYLGSRGAATEGAFPITHACVQLGTKTMAEMRVLAEVL